MKPQSVTAMVKILTHFLNSQFFWDRNRKKKNFVQKQDVSRNYSDMSEIESTRLYQKWVPRLDYFVISLESYALYVN